jgi:hypothetical protein
VIAVGIAAEPWYKTAQFEAVIELSVAAVRINTGNCNEKNPALALY